MEGEGRGGQGVGESEAYDVKTKLNGSTFLHVLACHLVLLHFLHLVTSLVCLCRAFWAVSHKLLRRSSSLLRQ